MQNAYTLKPLSDDDHNGSCSQKNESCSQKEWKLFKKKDKQQEV